MKIKRFTSPGKGNGLRSTARIMAGELVYSAIPLAFCVSNTLAKDVCHDCLTRRESLLRCSQCKMARYCDINCQKRAWPAHKRECRCLRSLLPRVPTDSVRLAARIIFTMLSVSHNSTEGLYTLEEHETHLSTMSEEKKHGLSQLASMLHIYLQHEEPNLTQEITSALPPSCQDPLSLLAKVACNCFTISDGEQQEIGVGLYPSLSLLNHDCRPNCVAVFQGAKLHLRAVKDIEPEMEVTISYIETLSVTQDRQRQLKDQYHFTCYCQRCDSQHMDELMLSGEEVTWSQLKEVLPRLETLQAEHDWQAVLEGCSALIASVGSTIPDENVYKLRIADMATDASIHLGRWEEALEYGTKTLPAYRQYFPDPHPVHVVQLMRVGKLQHYLGHTEGALDTLTQAYCISKVTHGNHHPLTADLLSKLEDCHAELSNN